MTLQMDISFDCECGHRIEDTVYVQDPDFRAERNKDSQTDSWQQVYCDNCDKEYIVQVTNTFYGAMCSLEDGGEISYGMPYYPESEEDELYWQVESTQQLEVFNKNLRSIEPLINAELPEDSRFSLFVMLHAHIVAAIEGYLSSVFIHNVTNSQELIRKLVETDPEFSRRTFSLKEIFEKQSGLAVTVASYLQDLIFHDLKKIKPMYLAVLGHDFGDISWLFNAVSIRHHCAHRAGYDKEGNPIDVSKESIQELAAKAEELVLAVEETLKNLGEPDELPF